jgi:hypothetical protein
MIQAAFGWSDYHLHDFGIGDLRWGTHLDDYPEDELDERTVSVVQALEGVRRFSYEYDFGDSWEHEIIIEDFWTLNWGSSSGGASMARTPAHRRTWAGIWAMRSSEKPSLILTTTSTIACWTGSAGRSTRRSSTWPSPTLACRRCADTVGLRVDRQSQSIGVHFGTVGPERSVCLFSTFVAY